MEVGIIEAGEIPPHLRAKYGDYTALYARFLHAAAPDLKCRTYRAFGDELPGSPGEADAWLISGSRHGVYDPLPWIPKLREFLRACARGRRPVVGVCFGHQILAEALGGKVEEFSGGWAVGVQDYTANHAPRWMEGAGRRWSGLALHRDQVIVQPPDSTVVAANDFCRIAALAYGDPERPYAISVQSHPEFPAGFVADIVNERRGTTIPEERAAPALASLDRPVDNELWARWIARFLRTASTPSEGSS
ncbi:MAG: type 1 glutamine amidotransferase [Paracoccaceae bacterium]